MEVEIRNGVIGTVLRTARPRILLDGTTIELPEGALVLPGFVDTHCHLMGLGMMRDRIDLTDSASAIECTAAVAGRVRRARAGEWIIGNGWNQERWNDTRMPTRDLLDEVAPENPVVLYRVDAHAVWVNSRALDAAHIAADHVDGGTIQTDADGTPTGILIDNAIALVESAMPEFTDDQRVAWLESAVEECLRVGITEVHDMNVEPERLGAVARLAERGGMRIRCNLFLQAQRDQWRSFGPPQRLAPGVDVVGVKYFTDGALGSRGAHLLEPYEDAPDTRGLELMSSEELVERAGPAIEVGYAVATHAIGDAACRSTLDAYERLRERFASALLRVEHAQTVHPDDQPRFGTLDVVAAMQATHCTSDAPMAERRLGRRRCAWAYPWRSLLDTGRPVLGGSDFPVESPNPIDGIRAFHFRRPDHAETAWFGQQVLGRHEALHAYTSAAPLGLPSKESIRRGRLRPGYDADIVVLDGDPFERADVRVLMTIVGGEIRYRGER